MIFSLSLSAGFQVGEGPTPTTPISVRERTSENAQFALVENRKVHCDFIVLL